MSDGPSAEQPRDQTMTLSHGERDETGTAIHAGDSPPRAAWPLWLVGGAWLAWLVFLVVMMVQRMNTTPV